MGGGHLACEEHPDFRPPRAPGCSAPLRLRVLSSLLLGSAARPLPSQEPHFMDEAAEAACPLPQNSAVVRANRARSQVPLPPCWEHPSPCRGVHPAHAFRVPRPLSIAASEPTGAPSCPGCRRGLLLTRADSSATGRGRGSGWALQLAVAATQSHTHTHTGSEPGEKSPRPGAAPASTHSRKPQA